MAVPQDHGSLLFHPCAFNGPQSLSLHVNTSPEIWTFIPLTVSSEVPQKPTLGWPSSALTSQRVPPARRSPLSQRRPIRDLMLAGRVKCPFTSVFCLPLVSLYIILVLKSIKNGSRMTICRSRKDDRHSPAGVANRTDLFETRLPDCRKPPPSGQTHT